MNFDEKFQDCEYNLNQIRHFEPDPFYVNHFFQLFIKTVRDINNGIFEEAEKNFGLFIEGKCNEKKFFEKAQLKQEEKALKFLEWFKIKEKTEHEAPYPNFIKEVMRFQEKFQKLPKVKVMIRAKERFSNDFNQEILVDLSNGKLRSKENLEIEVKRNLPVFLEIINNKRKLENKPKVNQNQITSSAFMQIGDKEYEIVYACEVYIPVLKRLLLESQEKISELTKWR